MDFTTLNQVQATTSADAFAQKLEAAKRIAGGDAALHDPREAGAAFEKLFATLLVKEMTKTLSDGFFGEGPGAETFQGWLEDELGGALAKDGSLGIAEAVRESLIRKQASIDGQPPTLGTEGDE
jgi:Rod binding domain-containing protein